MAPTMFTPSTVGNVGEEEGSGRGRVREGKGWGIGREGLERSGLQKAGQG